MYWLDSIVTPLVGVVAIVESRNRKKLLLIDRKFPPLGLAFPGGFMDVGETIAQTAIREVAEETDVAIYEDDASGLLCITSEPSLDPRAHFVVVAMVFRELFDRQPTAGDDALHAFWVNWQLIHASTTWAAMTERSKMEFNEYCRWRHFNEDSASVCGEWRLPKLG
jgi:8-oxo-dGTP diphosphatase